MVAAYNFNYFTRTCTVSLITDLKKDVKNRLLIFKESQDLLIDHIFFKMNFRKIYSGAISEELSKLTEKIWGFKREGVQKEHGFVNGKYVDNYILGLFRSDWKKMEIDSKRIKMWSQIGPRATFGLACLDLSVAEEKLMILTSDVSTSAGLDRYKKKYPKKYLDVGISEQNLIGTAAGLASEVLKLLQQLFLLFRFKMCRTNKS